MANEGARRIVRSYKCLLDLGLTVLLGWLLQAIVLFALIMKSLQPAPAAEADTYNLCRYAIMGFCGWLFCLLVFLVALARYFFMRIRGLARGRRRRRIARWSLGALGLLLALEVMTTL